MKHVPEAMIPPHALDAERSVLGSILIDNASLDVVTEILGSDDFYSEANAQIYECMREVAGRGQPLDVVTVRAELVRHERLAAVGGDEYLLALTNTVPLWEHVEAHARIIHRRAVARRMIRAGHEIAARGYHVGEDVEQYIDWSEQQVFSAARTHVTAVRSEQAKKIAQRRFLQLRDHQEAGTTPGVKTGIDGLDTLLGGGMHPGDVLLIAGRPGMGKSALAATIMRFVARHTGPGLWFSLEMQKELCTDRLLSSEGSIDGNRLRNARLDDEDWQRLAGAVAALELMSIEIDDTPGITLPAIRARARRVLREQGSLALIVIDYLQLARAGVRTESRENEVATVSRGLKELAKDLYVPVVALSQLNRDPDKRNDKRPELGDLRESGAQEQDADVVSFVYRDEVYHPATSDQGIAEIILKKQRSGPTGVVRARFFGEYTRFDNLEEWDKAPAPEPRPSKLEERALKAQKKKREQEAAE